MSRYVVEGPWREDCRQTVETYDGEAKAVVVTEIATLRDTRGGWSYPAGAHRVRVKGPGTGWPRARTFKGETAWSQADCYARECVVAIQRRTMPIDY